MRDMADPPRIAAHRLMNCLLLKFMILWPPASGPVVSPEWWKAQRQHFAPDPRNDAARPPRKEIPRRDSALASLLIEELGRRAGRHHGTQGGIQTGTVG